MPERGRSPGAKGTAYPSAQRPQKSVPRPAAGDGRARTRLTSSGVELVAVVDAQLL